MPAAPPSPRFSPDQLAEDFRVARLALEEGHAGIYRYAAKPEIDLVFERAAASLGRPMSALEFYRVLAPVVAAVKCGHTSVSLPADVRAELNNRTPLLPLQVALVGEQVYVLRDFSGRAGATLAGLEILSVNGVPAARAVATMLAAAPGDGDIQTSRRRSLAGWGFGVRLVTLLGLHSPFELTVRDAAAKTEHQVRIEGVALPTLRAAAPGPHERHDAPDAELEFPGGGRVAVMTIRAFSSSAGGGKSMKNFYRESFAALRDRGARALVIDLRNNGGGEDELGMLLLSHLLAEPFRYYEDLFINSTTFGFTKYLDGPLILPPASLFERRADGRLRFTAHPNWGVMRPSEPGFAGPVYVLINGGSFSTTAEFASQAHSRRRAVFVGEESGGAYRGNTSGVSARVTLPNTRLSLNVPLVAYHMAVGGDAPAARGVLPDHPVTYTVAELLAGADKELAVALRLARRK